MNYLQTDEQTINDLGIFAGPGKASIYELYNKTVTQGGGALMAQLFKTPLADEEAINDRSALYRFFSLKDYGFPVDSVTMGTVVYYMQNDDVRSQLHTGGQSLSQKMKSMVAADADYVFVEDGVQAVLRLFYQTNSFLTKIQEDAKGSAYEAAYDQLSRLTQESAFTSLKPYISDRHEAKISDSTLAELDKNVRFEYRERLLELIQMLYELDVCIAVGQVARKRNFHFANAFPREENRLDYSSVYHPHVEKAIANDLQMDKDSSILFLTGANMAGKSTLMKSIGIALYLAHMGFPVAAEKLNFSVRDGIFSNINLADNLNAGASHYYAEVLRVKEVVSALAKGHKLFVIFDELFRGTNVKDAYDATIALTRAFAKKSDSQFIISTHIMEAGELLQKEPLPIRYRFLPTEMQGSIPIYTRVLKDGITSDRQGMIIIQNEGVLEMLDKGLEKIKY